MKPAFMLRCSLLFAALIFSSCLVQAQGLDAERSRMEKRIPAIMSLKDRQAVGENNRGFLEVRGGVSGDEQKVVSDENSDRRRVYAVLAAQTGSSVDEVGRKRAEQLAGLAKSGHLIQDSGGAWRKK